MRARRVEFVNLAKAGVDAQQATVRLAAYHYRNGRRVLILARDQQMAQELDQALWTLEAASFIPHAICGQVDQAQEPVLIALEPRNLNQAQVIILTYPREPLPLDEFSLLVQLLPQQEGPELDACRELYRRLQRQGSPEPIHITSIP